MSDALLARDLVRTPGGRRVLDGVTLTAAPGRRRIRLPQAAHAPAAERPAPEPPSEGASGGQWVPQE
ncbi:hypothetical protein Misp03_46380 [Microbispora sp. NBRC 16548]|nr:hypothetical protein Misp03_46380 [Microbispora sp. NBRC 16548]